MKNSVMPKLRFKEFEGVWESKIIGETLSIGSGKDYKHLDSGDIPVYGTGGIMTYVNDFIFEGESIGIGRKGTIDKPVYLKGKFWTVDTLFYTHSFKQSIPKFIYLLFQRINWKLYNEASGVPSLSKSTIEKIKVNLPSLAEQEKIAAYLSAIDKKISLLKEKENELQLYKKGIMQKIFSQSLRFKDEEGKEFEEWEEKKLGEVVDNISSGKSKKVDNGKIPLYGSTGIIGFSENSDYCGTKILIARVGANAGYMYKVTGSYGVTDNTLILNVIDNNIDFIHSSLSYINLNRFIFGSGQPLITGGLLKNLLIQLPCVAEQEKIANFLSAIDEKIEKVKRQLEEMQAFKKGMLQQLFV